MSRRKFSIIVIFLTVLMISSIKIIAGWTGITYPPYSKLNTYPENGVIEDYTRCYWTGLAVVCKSRVKYCVNASKSSGLTENYAFTEVYVNDWSDSCNAYAEFNKNPYGLDTNSPGHIVNANEKPSFLIHIKTYGEIYSSKPNYPAFSEARLRFYIYIYKMTNYPNWILVDDGYFEYSTVQYGNMVFYVNGEGGTSIFWSSGWDGELYFCY